MVRNARLLLFGLTVVLIAIAALGLAGPLLDPRPALVACYRGEPARGGELHTQLAVDPRVDQMKFIMRVQGIDGGTVRWDMQDPGGHSVWSGREGPPAATYESGPISAVAGNWTINVVSESDQLKYEVVWAGTLAGEPLPTIAACLYAVSPPA